MTRVAANSRFASHLNESKFSVLFFLKSLRRQLSSYTIADILTLNCIVQGSQSVFPVEIAPTKYVGHLKELILVKKPKTFDGMEADELELWRLLDVADERVDILNNLVLDEEKSDDENFWRVGKMLSTRIISHYFRKPSAGYVHVAIKRPSGERRYWTSSPVRFISVYPSIFSLHFYPSIYLRPTDNDIHPFAIQPSYIMHSSDLKSNDRDHPGKLLMI